MRKPIRPVHPSNNGVAVVRLDSEIIHNALREYAARQFIQLGSMARRGASAQDIRDNLGDALRAIELTELPVSNY